MSLALGGESCSWRPRGDANRTQTYLARVGVSSTAHQDQPSRQTKSPMRGRRCPFPVQADIGLQSAPGKANPDTDFTAGAMHLYSLQESTDDLGLQIEKLEQPVVTLTLRPQS
jgi:hypothetical protein